MSGLSRKTETGAARNPIPSTTPVLLPRFHEVFDKTVFNIVLYHRQEDKADRACFERLCRRALEDAFKRKSRSKETVAPPSDQSYQEAFCAHLTESYAPFASLTTRDQFLVLLMTKTEIPEFLVNKINNMTGRSIHLSGDRKLGFIKLGEELILPSDINLRTLGKFFDSAVSAHRQHHANTPPPTVSNQRNSIEEIKQEVEELEDQSDEQPDPFYIGPEPEAQSQQEPEPAQAAKDKRPYRFTPYLTTKPPNKPKIQKGPVGKKPSGMVHEKSRDNVTPDPALVASTSSEWNQQQPTSQPGPSSAVDQYLAIIEKHRPFIYYGADTASSLEYPKKPRNQMKPPSEQEKRSQRHEEPGPSSADKTSSYQAGGPARIVRGMDSRTSQKLVVQQPSLTPPVPGDRENREVTRMPSSVIQGSHRTPPVPTPTQRLTSPPCPALIALLESRAKSPVPTLPPVSENELPMESSTMPATIEPSPSSPKLPARKAYPCYIKKKHLLETLQTVVQFANLTKLQKDVEKDLAKIGSELMIEADQVLVNLQVTITNLGMFSKKGTESPSLMTSSKAFMLMLHVAEQFDPLRHLLSDEKVENAKKENLESVIAVKDVEFQLNYLRRIFAHVK
ncbi:unnamed protein product [Caenorhabditis nigoni]